MKFQLRIWDSRIVRSVECTCNAEMVRFVGITIMQTLLLEQANDTFSSCLPLFVIEISRLSITLLTVQEYVVQKFY